MKPIYKIVTLLFICINSYAQEIPPIQNFTPQVYGSENQNWSIAQTANKYIYIANNKGLLEYNGANWELYPSPNNTIMRSVTVIDQKIYTGCYMEFGFWEKDNLGKLKYTSLSQKLKKPLLEDEQIWNILEFENWILFQSLHRIYIYNTSNQKFSTITSETTLLKIFKVDDSIFFQKANDGLYKIENGKEILISNSPIIKRNTIVNIHKNEDKIILTTQENGFYILEKNTIAKWETSSNQILSYISIYSSLTLKDGSFVIGTISHGIYHLNKNGDFLLNITQENGLNNNTVLSIFEDLEENIWMGLDNGISVLNFNSPFSIYSDLNGKIGTVYTSSIFKDKLYLGTNQGLFYKKTNNNEKFQMIQGTEGQVWSLKKIDNTLFCGHNIGTYIVKDTIAKKIPNTNGTWDLKQISENKILQGNYSGLQILEKKDGNWSFKNTLKGFHNSSRFFETTSNQEIFVNHEYKGIFKLKVDSSFSKASSVEVENIPKGNKSSILNYNDKLLYAFENGVFNYNFSKKSFEKDSVYTNGLFNGEEYVSGKLIISNNKLWGFSENSIVYFSPGKLNSTPLVSKIYLPKKSRRDFAGFESITHIDKEKYLFGTSNGYLILNLEKLYQKEYTIDITKITKRTLDNKKSLVNIDSITSIPYTENNLVFSFSVPTYEKYAQIEYQFKLEDRYINWSDWSKKPEVVFKNLPFGEYTFQVRAKIGNKITTNTASYTFTIARPWYLSNKMLVIYAILHILLFILVHSIYKHYYKRQQEKLIAKNQKEMERTQLENEREIMQLKNEKLQHDIESKSRELAASTMSIIKKNEFLNTIKKELSNAQNKDAVNPVIKIIDKNLNHTSDWELFQEAFNNADKDFLKKVKEKYTTLTPNDLRLCAYLRLNLSSKEIAPLLNISHKSVEIKRYRLRKKMGLTTKDNLIHHILEI